LLLLFCVQIAFEQCEGNLITFALLMHAWKCFTGASAVCLAGQWLGQVTGPGWPSPCGAELSPATNIYARLDLAQPSPKIKNKKIKR
jgi:hypothetical protein